jgi:hypothetical protein
MANMWEADPYTPTNTGNAFVDTGRWGEAPTFTENTWWNRNFGELSDFRNDGSSGPSNADLTKTLQGIGKAFGDSQKKDEGKPLPAAPIQSTPIGRPMRAMAIDQLAQILNKRRDDVYASAMTPGGQAQPYVTPHTIGLLGF